MQHMRQDGIDNELLMMLRSNKRLNKEVILYDPIGSDREEMK